MPGAPLREQKATWKDANGSGSTWAMHCANEAAVIEGVGTAGGFNDLDLGEWRVKKGKNFVDTIAELGRHCN